MAASIGYAALQIIPSIKGLSGELDSQMSGPIAAAAKKAGDQAGASLKMSASQAGDQFTKMGVGGLAVGVAIGGGFLAAGKKASDLGESVNAVQVTFGDAANGILELGKNAATSMGLSNSAFNGLAVQFSAFAKTIAGEGGNVTTTMQDLTQRAADFGSVMNIDIPEAAQIFQSALAGETEPIRKFGIDLSAVAVGAEGVRLGLADTAAAMTESDKVQARYSLLMQATAKDQGDFANTSGAAANAARIAKAELENSAASMGAIVAPAMAAGAKVLAKVATGFTSLNDASDGWVAKGVGIVGAAAAVGGGLSFVIGQALKMHDRFGKLGDAMTTFKASLHNSEGGLSKLGIGMGALGAAVGIAGIAFAAYEVITAPGKKRKEELTKATNDYTDALKAEADGQQGAVKAQIAAVLSNKDLASDAKLAGLSYQEMADVILGKSVPAFDTLVAHQQAVNDKRHSGAIDTDADNRAMSESDRLRQLVVDGQQAQFIAKINLSKEAMSGAVAQTELNNTVTAELGKTTETTTGAVVLSAEETKAQADALALSKAATEAAAAAQQAYFKNVQNANDALKKEADALLAQASAMRGSADAAYAVSDATDAYQKFLLELKQALIDTKGNQNEINALYRQGAALAATHADAVLKLSTEQAAANGVTLTATEQQTQWNTEMLYSAQQAGPAQRTEILAYIATAAGIPPEKVTDIRALMDAGKFDEAQMLLNQLSAARTTSVTADADTAEAEAKLAKLTRDRAWVVTADLIFKASGVQVGIPTGPGAASGVENWSGGPILVGERGPEIANLPAGTDVYTNTVSRQMMSGATLGQTAASPPVTINNYTREPTASMIAAGIRMAQLAS